MTSSMCSQPMCSQPTCPQRPSVLTYAGRTLILLAALTLGSCNFLIDEFTWLDHAGSVAGPQQQAPSATSDRP
jgi:hypothetical protein